MARGAHLRVALPQPCGIEAGSVRIEAAPALRRVAREAVTLGMAGDAALQTLARRLAVSEEKRALRVVEVGFGAEDGRGHDAGLPMARLTELAGVVATGTGDFLAVRGNRVAREKVGGMVTRLRGGVGPVALQTLFPRMAPRAGLRCGRGDPPCARPRNPRREMPGGGARAARPRHGPVRQRAAAAPGGAWPGDRWRSFPGYGR
jgi:hypothetical protein